MAYFVRRMTAEDIPQVSQIDREAFPTEWPPPSFRRELDSHLVRYLVAVEENHQSEEGQPSERERRGGFGGLLSRVGDLIAR